MYSGDCYLKKLPNGTLQFIQIRKNMIETFGFNSELDEGRRYSYPNGIALKAIDYDFFKGTFLDEPCNRQFALATSADGEWYTIIKRGFYPITWLASAGLYPENYGYRPPEQRRRPPEEELRRWAGHGWISVYGHRFCTACKKPHFSPDGKVFYFDSIDDRGQLHHYGTDQLFLSCLTHDRCAGDINFYLIE